LIYVSISSCFDRERIPLAAAPDISTSSSDMDFRLSITSGLARSSEPGSIELDGHPAELIGNDVLGAGGVLDIQGLELATHAIDAIGGVGGTEDLREQGSDLFAGTTLDIGIQDKSHLSSGVGGIRGCTTRRLEVLLLLAEGEAAVCCLADALTQFVVGAATLDGDGEGAGDLEFHGVSPLVTLIVWHGPAPRSTPLGDL